MVTLAIQCNVYTCVHTIRLPPGIASGYEMVVGPGAYRYFYIAFKAIRPQAQRPHDLLHIDIVQPYSCVHCWCPLNVPIVVHSTTHELYVMHTSLSTCGTKTSTK